MVLVDSNVLIDVLTDDPVWHEWSSEQLTRLGNSRQLAINPSHLRRDLDRTYFPDVAVVAPA